MEYEIFKKGLDLIIAYISGNLNLKIIDEIIDTIYELEKEVE